MNRLFPSLLAGWLGAAALALLLTTLAVADEPPDGMGPDAAQLQLELFPPVKPSDYWLGIGFRPLGEALRAQLALPEGQGLLVEQVMPETPAARAELKRHDIVLKVDGKPLENMQQLIDAVDAAKDGELALEIIRDGKPITIKVKPEKRPEGPVQKYQIDVPGHPGLDFAWQQFEKVWPGKSPFGFRRLNPGVILPPGALVHAPLPGNLSVTIRKQGDEPAKIDVQRGDESWSVDENELDTLPSDIGIHVKKMLGGVPLKADSSVQTFPHPSFVPDGKPRARIYKYAPFAPDGEGRLEKRLEEMNRRIERMQEMLEGFREKRPREKGSDKKPAKPKPPKVEQKEA